MMLAQRLYEGIEIGKEGAVGLITYMRTDSTRVGDDAIIDVRHYIGERYGAGFLPPGPNIYKGKKDAQDAHEAVRPTSMAYSPEVVEKYLAEDELLRVKARKPEQHFTQPPPRYNEAPPVKRMEFDGGGRPSTYACVRS